MLLALEKTINTAAPSRRRQERNVKENTGQQETLVTTRPDTQSAGLGHSD
jgi:hypothetical protein